MEALGRLFNIVPTADAVEVSLTGASAVTFVCVGADTYTIQQAKDAAGTGATNLPVIDHYYANGNVDGAGTWTRTAVSPVGAAVTIALGCAVIHVPVAALDDGFDYIRCSSTAGGLVTAIVHDLTVQRAPDLLPALGV
ncbi:hypothetical protein [Streptomyces rubradiris]|uniref:Uncharacterized protein n=1 Tax=Streptomyces rubradiris TaxID=285531 RepID=A0ABQ3R3M7_STRRR|nr:hypothetical protein [Streptomyces rubradiris]GHH30241.1 hypothetical protein GCM10018792_76480 [Streptomyces rubradiris]GHI50429.1 hypothetical protein Srubr_02750 [Streptomyces rubradiris]